MEHDDGAFADFLTAAQQQVMSNNFDSLPKIDVTANPLDSYAMSTKSVLYKTLNNQVNTSSENISSIIKVK